MTTETHTVTLTLSLDDKARPAEINRATTQLYETLLKSEADRVEKPHNETLEAGAKGDPITIGLIALTLGVPAVAGVFALLNSWLTRRLDPLTITLKLPNGAEATVPAAMPVAEREAVLNRLAAQLKQLSRDKEEE